MKTTDFKKIFKTNWTRKMYFVKWYVDFDKTEESYNKEAKQSINVEYETAMKWLLEEDVQEGIKVYLKAQRQIKILEIYDIMYKKAINGDVKSAEWCEKFFKSDFFENKSDEIDDFLEGINIPGLKEGDKNDK